MLPVSLRGPETWHYRGELMKDGERFEDAIDEIRKVLGMGHHGHEGHGDKAIIVELLQMISTNQRLIMAQIDDLNAALSDVANKLVTLDTDVKAIPTQTQTPPTDLTQVLSAVQSISNQVDAIDAEVKALQTPPPTA